MEEEYQVVEGGYEEGEGGGGQGGEVQEEELGEGNERRARRGIG